MRVNTVSHERPKHEDAAEVLSDCLQADALVLIDQRGFGDAQLAVYGMTAAEAAQVLRTAADLLDAEALAS